MRRKTKQIMIRNRKRRKMRRRRRGIRSRILITRRRRKRRRRRLGIRRIILLRRKNDRRIIIITIPFQPLRQQGGPTGRPLCAVPCACPPAPGMYVMVIWCIFHFPA